jgi:hypothetical protein
MIDYLAKASSLFLAASEISLSVIFSFVDASFWIASASYFFTSLS